METTTLPRADSMVALVGGAGIVVANVAVLRPAGWLWASGDDVGVVSAVALFVGFTVVAFGLPGGPAGSSGAGGLLAGRRVARGALFSSGCLAVLGAVGAMVFPSDPEVWFSPGGRAYGVVLDCLSSAQILGLVVTAVSAAGEGGGVRRGVRIGLGVLAGLAVVGLLVSYVWVLVPADVLQVLGPGLAWQGRVFGLAGCGVGVAIAWPWLAPSLDRAVRAVHRARARWVDSTP